MSSVLRAAISGLGLSGISRTEPATARVLAIRAIRAAVDDAGLSADQVDGLIVTRSGAASADAYDLDLARNAGLQDLRLLQVLHAEGTSAVQAVQAAALAVTLGSARHVVCVFADAALKPRKRASESFGRIKSVEGMAGLRYTAGAIGGIASHALVARRHMTDHGTTRRQLGAVAVSARRWAESNPLAVMRKPLSIDDYLAARWIAEPFCLFDCAMPVNGGIAVVVSAREAARDLRHPPVHVLGAGQGHRGLPDHGAFDDVLTGAALAGRGAFAQAGVAARDIQLCEFYDAFTINTLVMLEQYGFCKPGEAGPMAEDGAIAPGGRLPVNTGGGHLSGYYLQGMTPVSEAVMQVRGEAGERQCARHDLALVTGEGGRLDHHACLVLGSDATL